MHFTMRNILFNLTPVTSIPILSYFERTLLGLIIFTPNLPATQNIKKKRKKREKQFCGKVPPNNTLFAGTVLPNNTLFGKTISLNNTLFGGTPVSEKMK